MSAQIMMFILRCAVTLLVGFTGLLNLGQQHLFGCSCLPVQEIGGLSLGFELAQPESLQQTSSTPGIDRILADNFEGEFALTDQVLGSMNKLMEAFALGQSLDRADLMQGHEINRWLTSHGSNIGQNPLLANQASELDFVFGTFWSRVVPLIQQIITERPSQAGLKDLAFRCEQRGSEIQWLNEMAAKSYIYRILMDVFNTELYSHCLRRKMATLRLHHLEPPTVVRQLVDVYLELPLDVARAGSGNFKLTEQTRANYVNRMYADYGQNFNLERAIGRYGPVEQAVQLVLTNNLSFGGLDEGHTRAMATQFREQCARYTGQLLEFWANFDQVAALLSSETNNLAEFNNRLKYAQPHLVYASVCNQLANHRLT